MLRVNIFTNWTHISVQSEVSLGPVLSCDNTVPTVYARNDCSLKLLRCYDFHRHDWLQDDRVGLFHSCGENIEGNISVQ